MATNAISHRANWPVVSSASVTSHAVWFYVIGSLLAIHFAGESLTLRISITAAMLFVLALLNAAARHTALLVILILLSPPFKLPDGPSMYDSLFNNLVPDISISAFEILLVLNLLLAMGNRRRIKEDRRFDWLIVALGGMAAFGLFYGAIVKANPLQQVLSEVRPFGVLILAYFGTRLCITSPEENRWMWEILFTATLLKCLQGFYLNWSGIGFTYESSLRVFADAELLFVLILLIAGCIEQLHEVHLTRLFGLTVVAAFVLISSSRFVWAAAVLGMAIVVLSQRRGLIRPALMLGGLFACGVGAATVFAGPNQGLALRFATIFDWTGEASNVARLIEAQNALMTIQQQPLLGTGLGGEWIVAEDLILGEGQFRTSVFANLTLVHNAYLWMWLKLGLPGIILLLTIFVQSMRAAIRSIRNCSTMDGKYAWGVFAGLMSFYLILMAGNWLLHPRCMVAWGVLLSATQMDALTCIDQRRTECEPRVRSR